MQILAYQITNQISSRDIRLEKIRLDPPTSAGCTLFKHLAGEITVPDTEETIVREIDSPRPAECVAVDITMLITHWASGRPEDQNERNRSHQPITASQPLSSAGFSFHLLIN